MKSIGMLKNETTQVGKSVQSIVRWLILRHLDTSVNILFMEKSNPK